jgi:hypothetical protein
MRATVKFAYVAWRRFGRRAKYSAMQKYLGIALAGLAAFMAVQPQAVLGQGSLERRLAAAKRIECTFPVLATGNWDKNVPGIAVTPSELKAA